MRSSTAWPACGAEQRTWTPRIPPDLVSAGVRRRHSGPYSAAAVPLIGARALTLPGQVTALAEEVSFEIARFDTELGPEMAPFASVLLRSESSSSSLIENLTAGAKSIALAELGNRGKRNATEIVGNVAAMTAAIELVEKLDAGAILQMHAALFEDVHPEIAGRWREEQVWIGGSSFGPHQADFVPPHHEHVVELIDDLVTFARRDDLPVLAQAAVAHAQFETIHPFPDGNGRTGRAIIHAMLRGHGLTRNVTVPVSAGLLIDTNAYFTSLWHYRQGDPSPIVGCLAAAATEAITNGRQLVGELRALRAGWDDVVAARAGSAAWRIADLLLRQPVIDATAVARELGMESRNVPRALEPLFEAGVLTEFTGFKRNRLWQAREVLAALDDFAARAGRRR